jgi:hypothetical protein
VTTQTTDDPGYWIYETSGVLRPAVEAYLNGAPLTNEHIAALRAYFRQWISSPVWDQNPYADIEERDGLACMRAGVDGLTTREAIEKWLDAAMDGGLDPLGSASGFDRAIRCGGLMCKTPRKRYRRDHAQR